MYVKSSHARGVSRLSLIRAIYYSLLPPSHATYTKQLKEHFGSSAQLFLNTESFLTMILRNLPERVPGMCVGVDSRHVKRLGKVIERAGLKIVEFSGQKSLGEVMANERLLAIVLPDSYEVFSRRYKQQYNDLGALKIVYQNRKRPRSVSLGHDVYIWEKRQLPRTVSGCVAVLASESFIDLWGLLKKQNYSYPRLENRELVEDIRLALKGKENRYRRVDRRPPRILPRMLYDFYK